MFPFAQGTKQGIAQITQAINRTRDFIEEMKSRIHATELELENTKRMEKMWRDLL